MPIVVFGNCSHDNVLKIDTSLFVQKLHLRTIYIEANIDEDIDLKNKYRIKILPYLVSIGEAASKNYVDNKFNDPSLIKNTKHVDFKDENLDNVHSIKINSFPTFEENLTPKIYVDQILSEGVDESSVLRLHPDEKLKLDEQNCIVLNSSLTLPKTIKELPTENYVDSRLNDPSIIRNNTHVDFNEKNLDDVRFIKINSFPAIPKHLIAQVYVDQAICYSVDESSLLRLDPDEKLNLDEQDSILLNSGLTSLKIIIELPTKNYVDS